MLITPQAVGDTFNFSYNGAPQTFTAPNNGYYQIELRGAEGGIYQYRG
ncbi:MAG: hypothetical protein LBP53_02730 [Candidatus Peribacteria bacterium]|nr:hypothetical protein [Candidatus Peribacteria bacterium]